MSAQALLAIADDELVLGWRNSEWTGIAPFLEEDVAFSSIAQNEIGHARALYELVARENGSDSDAVAFDRDPMEYRCSPFVELRLADDWAATIARHWLYETADAIRIQALVDGEDAELAGLAAKIQREEAYHAMHAQMWHERLRGDERYEAAVAKLWPYAAAMLEQPLRPQLAERTGLALPSVAATQSLERGGHTDEWPALWDEMTMVRRSVPGAAW